jgi:hypothetical protein
MKTKPIAVLAPATSGVSHPHVSDGLKAVGATITARQDSRSPETESDRIRFGGPQAAVDLASIAALNAILHPALSRIYDDFLLARNLCLTQPGQFAHQLASKFAELQSLGLSEERARWLILKGYLAELETLGEPAHGATSSLAPPRHFGRDGRARLEPSSSDDPRNQPRARRNLSPDALVALSPAGFGLLQAILTLLDTNSHTSLTNFGEFNQTGYGRSEGTPIQPAHTTPEWCADLRELHFNGLLVKRFKFVARNQELILAAFEEEHWPPHIDDPLPPHDEINPKFRLRDTIAKLNRHQQSGIIRFSGDGTGRGIHWRAAS